MGKDENDLAKLKKDYNKIQLEFNLPSFEELNKDFYIEKIAETETDFLVREVRRFIADRLSNYMRLVETMLNPVNVQMFVFSVIKLIGVSEKKKLSEIYQRLAKKEIEILKLDIEFSEQKEADFIKESFQMWQEIKKEMLGFLEVIERNWDNKDPVNGKGYFN